MASINGLEVKALKSFRGHEGETCYQGNLYLNGKKIASWSNSRTMGPDSYDFEPGYSEKKLEELIRETYKGYKLYCLELLIEDLINLKFHERNFKKSCNPVMVLITREYPFPCPYYFHDDCGYIYSYKEKELQESDEIIQKKAEFLFIFVNFSILFLKTYLIIGGRKYGKEI